MSADLQPTAANPLSRLETARGLLAQASSVDEVKSIRDKAEAARTYAREAKLGLEAQNYAAEIKIRAERRAGELLAEMPKQDGGDAQRTRFHAETELAPPPKLADLGISRVQSHRWQAIATVPEQDFDEHIEAVKEAGQELTTASVVQLAEERRRVAAETDTQEVTRVMGTVFEVVPGAEERVNRAALKATFSRAVANTRNGWLALDPEAVADTLDVADATRAQRFMDDCEAWFSRLRAVLAQPVRAIK